MRLVDTEVAAMWIGRPRECLYRWAREQRITRHGGNTRGTALWNLDELPQRIPGHPHPEPPPKKAGTSP